MAAEPPSARIALYILTYYTNPSMFTRSSGGVCTWPRRRRARACRTTALMRLRTVAIPRHRTPATVAVRTGYRPWIRSTRRATSTPRVRPVASYDDRVDTTQTEYITDAWRSRRLWQVHTHAPALRAVPKRRWLYYY